MTMTNNVNNYESIKELKKQLRRRHISAGDAYQLPRTLRMLVRQEALEFELEGDIQAVIDLYTQVSEGLQRLTEKVPPIYKLLIDSSAQFWQSEAEKAEAKKIAREKQTTLEKTGLTRRPMTKMGKSAVFTTQNDKKTVGSIVKSPSIEEKVVEGESHTIKKPLTRSYRQRKLSRSRIAAKRRSQYIKKSSSTSLPR